MERAPGEADRENKNKMLMMQNRTGNTTSTLSLKVALIPIVALVAGLVCVMSFAGPLATGDYAPYVLLGAAVTGLAAAYFAGAVRRRPMLAGLKRSATQLLPAIPILGCIALVSTTWMSAGVVPLFIDYGLQILDPAWFLVTACAICAVVSVVTGSSWSTIATMGVAFIGIGDAMGLHPGWTAGAIISGAYFGDKISPLSDTTVIASSTCGVDLFTHIRNMLPTTLPAFLLALGIFTVKGLAGDAGAEMSSSAASELEGMFNLSPWLLVIPVLTVVMLALRCSTLVTLLVSATLGVVATLVMQPQSGIGISGIPSLLWSGFHPAAASEAVSELTSTGGIMGISPVVLLILCALVFGWVLIGTGMLRALTEALTSRLRGRAGAVVSTLGAGLTLNATTADQYLSIIIGANMFRPLYRGMKLEPKLLSRTLEDAISATSPLIPWSSCGVTQATVLGVSTLVYLPFCFFNYLTPLMALLLATPLRRLGSHSLARRLAAIRMPRLRRA